MVNMLTFIQIANDNHTDSAIPDPPVWLYGCVIRNKRFKFHESQ